MRTVRGMTVLLFVGTLAFAQNISVDSYRQARKVLDAGLQAHGGQALEQMTSFSGKFEGELIHRNQSRRPEAPYDRTPLSGVVAMDYKSGDAYLEQTGSWVGGFNWSGRTVRTKDGAVNYDLRNHTATSLPQPAAANLMPNLGRRAPIGYLREAKNRSGTLRYVGKTSVDGKAAEAISYAAENTGVLITLYFDASTHLVTKTEAVDVDVVAGDSPSEVLFSEYVPVNGVQLPKLRRSRHGGELDSEVRYAWTVNQPLDAAMLRAPEGFPAPVAGAAQGDPLVKLADNVYVFRTSANYNVLLVGMQESVFVMEAPGNDKVTAEVLAKAKDIFAGKPVKYAAVSHFHDDHAGGARGYMAEGITLVTTPGNRAFFERVKNRNSSISGDKPVPASAKIETVSGRRIFSDGTTTVELIDIGKGPHTDEMLVAYLPQQKIVFQGDLLNLPNDKQARPANLTTQHFARRLKELGLDVDTIAAVHGPVAKQTDLDQAMALAAQEAGSRAAK